jgi:6-phosphogluconate dehydrogenase (decarboxylating)
MQLGMIGLGRMGGNMVIRWSRPATIALSMTRSPRAAWLIIPAAAVDPVLADVTKLLEQVTL